MIKKKTLKEHVFLSENIPHIKLHDESRFDKHYSNQSFQDQDRVAKILFQCLIENDPETFMEILDVYLDINRTRIANKTNLTRATITKAFSKNGNPTLKTIAKIIHEAVSEKK